jgi:hypothetical protein
VNTPKEVVNEDRPSSSVTKLNSKQANLLKDLEEKLPLIEDRLS